MRRYALFQGETYYPGGGWDDFAGLFDTPDEACAEAEKGANDWAHVVHLTTGEIIRQGSSRGWTGKGLERAPFKWDETP